MMRINCDVRLQAALGVKEAAIRADALGSLIHPHLGPCPPVSFTYGVKCAASIPANPLLSVLVSDNRLDVASSAWHEIQNST